MNIDWNSLRPFNDSLNSAFEELCCQLAASERVPAGSAFKRKGVPDAGVECFWKLPGGKELTWQAKFFSELGDAQWRQLDKSVETALEKHSDLVTYTICLPLDLRDPRIPGRTDLMEKWESQVEKWRGWASAKGMSVEFPYWGEHQIWERLSREEHRGRYFFWFNREFFSQKWLADLVEVAIANAGPRYTPELHVGLPVAEVFEGLGRTRVFFDQIKVLHSKLRKTRDSLRLEAPHPDASQPHTALNDQLQNLFTLLEKLPESRVAVIDFPTVTSLCGEISTSIWEAERLLDEVKRAKASTHEAQDESKGQPPYLETGHTKHYLRELSRQIRELEIIAGSKGAQLANTPALLLAGGAGTGKSHLFCDVARQRTANGSPTVLLLGESFSTDDPWMQIVRMLGLTCSRDELLGALEAAAQAADARAVIIVDALNEGEGKQLWHRNIAGMLKILERCHWISLAVSVRSSYESTVIPDGLVPGRLIRVEHPGFSGLELEAATTFFNYYKIKAPSVPLLSPEFQNPLFLKLFCKGLENQNLREIPKGLQGITAIFDFFIESANSKLSKVLDYDPASDPVRNAINALVEVMAASGDTLIPREDAKAAVEFILPSSSWEKSLFRLLISEGIIAEDRKLTSWENEEWIDLVRFSYERLTDHLITECLLNQHLNAQDPFASFSPEQPLGSLVKDEHSCWANRGIIEALCIQLPERLGRELFDLAPQCADWQPALESFIDSLIWRSPRAFGETFSEHINQTVNQSVDLFRQFLNGLLTIATNPDHPLNADFLDRRLKRDSMARRDAWWSILLHREYSYYDTSAVGRLVDWGWSPSDKSHISDESLRLCGVSLLWFLTSSNRFLRDRSTKALVCLFTSRIPVLRQLLRQFQGVNDFYVMERLYAVAYGCALRSSEKEEIGMLAGDVYEQVFKDGSPPVHILLRDYARGVIEIALQLDIDLPIEGDNFRPPYGSTWPDDIPAADEVEAWAKKLSDGDAVRSHIYSSVMDWGDFARYIIGTNSGLFEWTSRRLSEASEPTRKEIFNSFKDSLTERQEKQWQAYQNVRDNLDYFLRIDEPKRRDEFGEEITEELFKQVLALEEQKLRNKLGKMRGEVFDKHILPYLNHPEPDDEHRFDLSMAQRFVLKRVVEMGWQQRLFGAFDENVDRSTNDYRAPHKAERIGKKYQWIAWHEFLARVADNFEYRSDEWSGRKEVYEGPWRDFVRNIDPSCLLNKTGSEAWPEHHAMSWWVPEAQNDWGKPWIEQDPDEDWIKRADHLPSCESLIDIVNPADGSRWLSLDLFQQWYQAVPVGEDKDRGWRKQLYLFLNSYLVRRQDSDEVFEWLQQQDFFGRWMPEPHDLYYCHVFLGEFFRAPAYRFFNIPYYHHEGWTRGGDARIPKPVFVSTERYFCESQNFDCSIDGGYRIKMPSSLIVEEMNLTLQGSEGEFCDASQNLMAFDPSVHNPGPGALLIRKDNFLQFLEERGYDVLWTVLGEKMNWNTPDSSKQLGRLMISGAYRITKDGVSGCLNTNFDERWASS